MHQGEVLTATAVSDVARLGGAIAARIRQAWPGFLYQKGIGARIVPPPNFVHTRNSQVDQFISSCRLIDR